MTSELGASTEHVKTFVFQETQFMAVTAYQNHMVSPLPARFTNLLIRAKKKCMNVFFVIGDS